MMLIAVRVRNRQSKKCTHNLTISYLFSQRTFKQKVQTDTMDVFKKQLKWMRKFKRVSIIWKALLWIYNGMNIFLLHET